MSPFIEPEVLATLLNDPQVIILDARFSLAGSAGPDAGLNAYRLSHIPGARYIDLERDLSAQVIAGETSRHPLPTPETFARCLQKLGVKADSHVVVYDDGGHAMAARAWWQLRWVGVNNVKVLHGGFKDWIGDRYPVTNELPEVVPSEFAAAPDNTMLISADDITRQLDNPQYRLIDARSPERFAGEVEPLDTKAGHIPGAVCRPFTANMDDSGRFLSPEVLKEHFQSLQVEGLEPILYCGSGVTACHNLLAMEYAGLGGAKLYAGSWSEWITDDERPVATGQ